MKKIANIYYLKKKNILLTINEANFCALCVYNIRTEDRKEKYEKDQLSNCIDTTPPPLILYVTFSYFRFKVIKLLSSWKEKKTVFITEYFLAKEALTYNHWLKLINQKSDKYLSCK